MIDLQSILYANERLVPAIYDTVVDPTRWDAALAETAEFLGATALMHSLTFWISGRGKVMTHSGMPEGSMDLWEKKYATNDWPRAAAELPAGEVLHSELPPMDVMIQTEVGRDILAATDFVDLMAVRTTEGPLYLGALSFYGNRFFEHEMVERFEFLVPHFARALALNQRIARLSLRADAFESGIQRIPAAVFLLSSKGEILYQNDASTELIEQDDGIGVLESKLLLSTPRARQSLKESIEQALQPGPGGNARGLFRIDRSQGLRSYHAVVSPVAPRLVGGSVSDAVLLWITDPESTVVPVDETIGLLLGLTPAESNIASAIARGQSVQEHAEERGVTVGSARWTLKQVLAKTQARNQADLVRVILGTIPSPPF